MFKIKSVTVPLALMSVLALAACSKKDNAGAPHGPAPVGYIVVHTQPIQLTQDLSGRTSAWLVSDVRPQVSGIIKARLFTEGGLVRAGQSLYQIDPATYQAAFDSAQAQQAQAQANADAAKIKADRAQQLITIKAISQQDYDDAETALKTAQAALALQKANVESARINLNYTRVLSPISGRIGKSSVTPGALVTASQATALATVQDLSKIYVDITQSSSDLLKLKQAMAAGQIGAVDHADVTLTLDDGQTYNQTGRLEFSEASVDPSTGSVTLRAVFPNPDGLLLPGMFVQARIIKGVVSNGVLIPQGAVILDPKGGATVLIVGADGKAQSRKVGLGQMIGSQWQITSGLQSGDKVITEGAMKLKAGSPIKATPQKTAPPATDSAE
ncbi:efflux RND transporter periplasmic adaptor subunit [Asticcacaulis sp. EMRT-3]|uniref:efflux RND transporter periplasmic adaptor subunit n=1 Tax=Asticcacaulis sp. EMRT-3 TaxID=3040349 RepID=UPI0024AFB757|nr:efflux RND transporter periplasmic adaptor subunit [Asticcacaulis sp. EMRT-3]MDI7776472.1 efflux RND transporter periplasmic adaptor subunit [Asticcacaulis sp. EMRT-3]